MIAEISRVSTSMNIYGTVAPAKINLGLQVVRRRADGFHDINTVFYRVAPVDRLLFTVQDQPDIDITLVDSPLIPLGDNLVYRAAALVQQYTGTDRGARIVLEKRIPSGAGLGGGSSDAATTLLALRDMWDAQIGDEALLRMGAQLGSDVPFFLLDTPAALAGGRGERLEPLDIALPYWTLIVNPGIHVSTPWAYSALNRQEEIEAVDFAAVLHNPEPEQLRRMLVNDFEPVVFAEHALLAEIKSALYQAGAVVALMSGSGSSLFGMFTTQEQARAAAEKFPAFAVFISAPNAVLTPV